MVKVYSRIEVTRAHRMELHKSSGMELLEWRHRHWSTISAYSDNSAPVLHGPWQSREEEVARQIKPVRK
uniref:Uncharacterized protein n=1 Tax=Physcomitrium patens TaxID=3218 RepID=A0A2K1IYL9_PHYPA|nr:hypothetical protein PHYPA_024189 [Physcomitrium patens]